MNEMQYYQHSAIGELENADGILRGLSAVIEIMCMGMGDMNNGEWFADALRLIQASVNDVRAKLDEATGAVIKMRTVKAG